ncbi:futalosine hydrolase [Ferruginibacter sp. HRS2-29]|uniref:futalosine hydrolase n=1 Tax=Ferruginibacter sp. HRS2-29 TaxID=2487334 RepID=UPI0020CBAC10|nr:futalosine hydrolase [Ferruginibacter sp. HRS2-29]MCP9750227.1 futalosine hydrolase [Ferruginibacter sp. HRS2-29]
MQILVIAATEMEITPFIEAGLPVDILTTGVGVPATIYNLLKKIQEKQYDLVIQAGIAGVFSPVAYELASVVMVRKDTFADLGIEEKKSFKTLFDLGFALPDEFPYKNGWLNNDFEFFEKLPLQKVTGITVNKVSDEAFQAETFLYKFSPDIESMEGAALHFVCLQENIPFLQLRSISNVVGERDKAKWKIRDAVVNLNAVLSTMVNSLLNE